MKDIDKIEAVIVKTLTIKDPFNTRIELVRHMYEGSVISYSIDIKQEGDLAILFDYDPTGDKCFAIFRILRRMAEEGK